MTINIVNLMNTSVLDQWGRKIPMHWLWQKQPAIIVFIRHFACIACRGHVSEIWQNRDQYKNLKARIYFVGNGQPQMIEAFKQDLQIEDAVIFTDPTLASFQAAGFRRGFLAAVGPKSLKQGIQLYQQGHKQKKYQKEDGDLWQLGGVVCVSKDGKILFHHISQSLGDIPSGEELAEKVPDKKRPHEIETAEDADDAKWLLGPDDETDLVFPEE